MSLRREHDSNSDSFVSHPNDKVQQRGRRQRLHASKSRNAGPVCCNGWFGLKTLNVPDAT
jgi:hypothetical protein